MKTSFKALFLGVLAMAGAGLYVMPRMVQSSIPSVYYITPNTKTYENIVNCTGTIQSSLVRSIYLDNPLVADEVHVSVGDRVQENDVLISVNQEKTAQLQLSSLEFLRGFSGLDTLSRSDPLSSNGIDWSALASAYGLNSTVTNGGTEQLTQQLQGLLSDIGLMGSGGTEELLSVSSAQPSIFAPIGGIITDVSISPNMTVSAGQSVITILDDTQYKVVAAVSESDIAKVTVGDAVTIRGVGFSGTYTGEVVKIFPTARKAISGSSTETVVDVEIRLDNADSGLKPGFTAKVEIVGGEDYRLLTVPYEAIRQDENNDEYVYLYEDGKIKKSLVITGKELTNEVQILDGVAPGSIVVFNPGDIKQEGMMIHIMGRANVD